MSNTAKHQDEIQFYSELLRVFFDSANDAIFVLCDEMKFIMCNQVTQHWLGYSEDELTAHNHRVPITELLGNPDRVEFFKRSFQKALNGEKIFFETLIKPLRGAERWVEFSMKRVDIESGDMVIAIARDISQRKKNLATIEYKTYHDSLTNVPNRNYLLNVIIQDESSWYNQTDLLTLVCLDLEKLKGINESLGQKTGDLVLQEISRRLANAIDVASGEQLLRLEGGKFLLVLPDTSIEKARNFSYAIKESITQPLLIKAQNISIDCSVGIANFPEHTADKEKLVQYAEFAMYGVKGNRQGIGIYDHEVNKQVAEKFELIADLREAINSGQIIPNYQPILNIKNAEEIHLEVLARWNHATRGVISPEVFIALAEEAGIIYELTSKILNQSIKEGAELLIQGKIKKLCINISAICMTNLDLVRETKKVLALYGVAEHQIVFEITESTMMSESLTTEKVINALHISGITFSIDDFGTGYSSLSKLKQLPLSELKIDKSFILHLIENENDAAIAKATIQMAHTLGLKVVAEGIENEETWHLLDQMGCDFGQGFWMGKPMPWKKVSGWLKDYEDRIKDSSGKSATKA